MMSRNQAGQSLQQPADFLTQQNYNALLNYSRKTIMDKEGQNNLPEKTERRLASVLNHYMKEVGKSNPGRKIQELNREVLRETLTSIDSWLRRGGESTSTTADTDRLYSNVGQQLASFQKERGLMTNAPPAIKPDFRDKVEEDEESDVPELVSDGSTGYIVPKRDAQALADKLEILITNAELRNEMGQAGKRLYEEKFTIEIFEKRIVEILQTVLKDSVA